VQQSVSPKLIILVVTVLVAIVAVIGIRVYTAPTAKAAPAAARGTANPRAGGAPTAADLQRMREYNAAHPGASSSFK